MLLVLPILLGAGLGALVGRWWAVLVPAAGAVAFLVWALTSGTAADTPWPFLIVLFTVGVVGGVVLRRRLAAANEAPHGEDPPLPPVG